MVGVLASLAIPAYRHAVQRARVSEGLTLAQPLRHAVVEYVAIHGHLPRIEGNGWTAVLDALGQPNSSQTGAASGTYVKRIWWHNNPDAPAIYIKYRGGTLDDRLLYLNADLSGAVVAWHCAAPPQAGVPDAMLPASCR